MSNGFDLTRSCEEQGLTGSELQKCKDYQKKYKSIGAPSDVDLTGGGYYQKTYLPKRRAEQDAKGFLPWLFETTGGEEITKLWNQSRVDYNNAAASDDPKFAEKRQELLGIASKNLKDIYDNAYISKNRFTKQGENFNKEEFDNIWRQQEGFEDRFLNPLARGDGKWKESYNAALDQYSAQQLQKADDKVKDLYGEDVLNDYIKNGRDISKINLNLFDKKIIDEAVKEAQLNAAKRFLDTTNEDDVSRVLYPALDKYLFSEEDKDEMGLLPNQRVAYDNEQIKQQLMADGCFSYSTVEEIKPGQEVECKGKKYKLREYQTGEQMASKYNDGMKDLQARADKIQDDINEAQKKTAPLLKEINELKSFNSWFPHQEIDCLYKIGSKLDSKIESIKKNCEKSILNGNKIIFLTDQNLKLDHTPIPMLLVISAVHHHLIEKKLRSRVSLIAVTGDVIEDHHFAALISLGASAIYPHFAYEIIFKKISDVKYYKRLKNYRASIEKGLLKIMSKI